MRLSISVLVLVILVAGCVQKTVAPPPPVFTPPAPRTPITPSMIVSQNFDATWNALVDYVSSNSFTIDVSRRNPGC